MIIEDSTAWAPWLLLITWLPVTDCLVMDCKVKSAWGSLYPDVTLFYLNRKVPFWHCCSGVRLEVSGLMLIYPGQWLDRCLFPLNMGCVRAGVRKQVGSHLENRSGVCEGSRKRVVKEFLIGLFLFSFLLTRFGRWRERPRLEVAMNKSSHCAVTSSHLGFLLPLSGYWLPLYFLSTLRTLCKLSSYTPV